MRVQVVGGGGREHSLVWALSGSPLVEKLICAPGNAGIAELAECVAIAADDIEGQVTLARERAVDFVVVGPEAPLVAGLVDQLEAAGIKAFGPSAAAARLEGSKGFTKDLCQRAKIPTAAYRRFAALDPALAYIREQGAPLVVKADGLAAGKGVTVARSLEEAETAARDALSGGIFGEAGRELVVEAFLEGEEASFFALVDGEAALPLIGAQDHKQVFDGDKGPNTGGMGAYSPAPVLTPDIEARVMTEIIEPTVRTLHAEGTPYKGVLYAGLMITDSGPQLIEYNVRFGDPECQVLMMRLKSDLLPALMASRDGVLHDFDLRWYDDPALCVVMASEGYPGATQKGSVIEGLEEAAGAEDGVEIFHAGTARDAAGRLIAVGGRVLNVTATGATIAEAQARAYRTVDRIRWPQGFCRRDIGWRALERET